MSKLIENNIAIAGLGNVGSNVLNSIIKNHKFIISKSSVKFNVVGISAKNKLKKRIVDISKFKWFNDPLKLADLPNCDIIIELIGEEKGLSYKLVKKALTNKINIITANKALLSKHGKELFKIAEKNNVLLLFEAAVCGGIPLIKAIKNSIFLDNIKKITGILNGTTNFILSEMESKKLNFSQVLTSAQKNGYAELNPKNDIEGIDSAHKLSLLSTLCFGVEINFKNVTFKGISKIDIQDIINAKKLGYKIKLISESQIIDNKLVSVVEPKLIKKDTRLARVNGVLNAVEIETVHLESIVLEGEGAGGKATASSVISDLYEIALKTSSLSLGYKTIELKKIKPYDLSNKLSSYYLRIHAKDIPGVLAKITSNLNKQGISIETILQIPDNKTKSNKIPIIIVTHQTKKILLMKALKKIENLNFIKDKIAVIIIDKKI